MTIAGDDPLAEQARDFSHTVLGGVLELVRIRTGETGVVEVLAAAGEERSLAELEDPNGWSSYACARSLLEAAAVVLGGSHRLREVARHGVWAMDSGEMVPVLQTLGSPGALLQALPMVVTKLATAVAMEAVCVGEQSGTVFGHPVDGQPRFRELCDVTAGALRTVPMVFGLGPADVNETTCVVAGDERCTFEVAWSSEVDPAERVAALEAELAAMTARFDGYQRTVTSLISGGDIDALLERIALQATTAVRAPAHLLAVRLDDRSALRVHHDGIDADDLDKVTGLLLADTPDSRDGASIILDVASDHRRYGRIAALNPDGAPFLAGDSALLAAYAGLAAAVLDTAGALDRSRRQATTAHALLDLAQALAEAPTALDVADTLAAAVPTIVDCDMAAVYLYERSTGLLEPAAFEGLPPVAERFLSEVSVAPADTPLLARMAEQPGPLQLADVEDDPFVMGLLDTVEATAVVMMPLVCAGQYYGVLIAVVVDDAERLAMGPELLEVFGALAAQSSVALRNAELVAQIKHDALHDDLTGLANRALFEDRAALALHQAQRDGTVVTVLFVDLDDFKAVNDSYGHRAGDEVLCQVGERLRASLRAADTVARLGGDEFVVLLCDPDAEPDPDGAAQVAAKLVETFDQPFALDAGGAVVVSCSVGVSTAGEGDDVVALLGRADEAMYRAKGTGPTLR